MKRISRNDPCPCGSGRKYKHCCMKSDRSDDLVTVRGLDDETVKEIEQIFSGRGEELTDVVIGELVARGWPKDDLLYAQSQGYKYNRERDSLVGPVEVEGNVPGFNV